MNENIVKIGFCVLLVIGATIASASNHQVTPGTGLEAVSALTLPTVDISGEQHRHVIIAQGTPDIYQGHPNTVLLPDGKTMFVVWSLNHGWGEPFMKRSDDAGLTWEHVSIPENWNDSWNTTTNAPGSNLGGLARGFVPMIHYVPGPNQEGMLLLFDRGQNNRFIQSTSTDMGKTWTPMRQTELVGIEASMTIISSLDKERLMMWNTAHLVRPVVFQAESFDGGLTWTNQRDDVIDFSGLKGVSPCEPAVIRSPDGQQLLMFIRDISSSRNFNSLYAVSDDDGKTWSKPKRLPGELTGDRHAPLYLPDGRLIVAMRDTLLNGTSPSKNHFIAWVGNYEDIIKGKNGQFRIKLLHNHRGLDNAYPSLELLPDGTVVATTYVAYTEGRNHQSIVSTRFKIEEIDDMLAEGRSILQPLPARSRATAGFRKGDILSYFIFEETNAPYGIDIVETDNGPELHAITGPGQVYQMGIKEVSEINDGSRGVFNYKNTMKSSTSSGFRGLASMPSQDGGLLKYRASSTDMSQFESIISDIEGNMAGKLAWSEPITGPWQLLSSGDITISRNPNKPGIWTAYTGTAGGIDYQAVFRYPLAHGTSREGYIEKFDMPKRVISVTSGDNNDLWVLSDFGEILNISTINGKILDRFHSEIPVLRVDTSAEGNWGIAYNPVVRSLWLSSPARPRFFYQIATEDSINDSNNIE